VDREISRSQKESKRCHSCHS